MSPRRPRRSRNYKNTLYVPDVELRRDNLCVIFLEFVILELTAAPFSFPSDLRAKSVRVREISTYYLQSYDCVLTMYTQSI